MRASAFGGRSRDVLLAALLLVGCQVAAPRDAGSCDSAPGCGFDVSSYRVELTPRFADGMVTGQETISLSLLSPQERLGFSNTALEIASDIRVNGAPARIEREGGILWIVLPHPQPAGADLEIELRFAGAPARGVVWTETSVYSSYFACDWMICPQDKFGDKAGVELDLILPAGLESIGPGALADVVDMPSGLQRHTWREERGYSPYLYAFAAGDYAVSTEAAGAVSLQYMGNAADADELSALFSPTADMLAFFESKAGVAFPHARYVQLLVPESAAQEAAGHSVIGRPQLEPMIADPQDDWVIAHELAHQWWGNLVTAEDLSEFWLNEGVVTFMTAAWKEHRWGREAYEREIDVARGRWTRAAETFEDVPLTFAGDYPSLSVRRGIQYGKGAVFMDALRRELGEDAFWSGLALYTEENAGGVVVSSDLQAAFEAASGRSLQPLFDEWVY